jgi:hypothetical protein
MSFEQYFSQNVYLTRSSNALFIKFIEVSTSLETMIFKSELESISNIIGCVPKGKNVTKIRSLVTYFSQNITWNGF